MQNNFGRVFSRRGAFCFFIIMLLFLSCILRIAVITASNYADVQQRQNSYRISVGKPRGTIYDCNMFPITNSKSKILAAVSPTPRAITSISNILSGEELESVLESLKSGKPTVCELPEIIDVDGITCTTVYQHNSFETPAIHLIGYTDVDSHGVSGLEIAYDDILYSDKDISFVYTVNGHGSVLDGIKPTVENNTSAVADGVVSTIDLKIQTIVEEIANSIETGAIIIAEPYTSKIRACVSRPNFDCTKIVDFLNAENSPLLNRAINSYNVGSIFKPCVAAAGIENGKIEYIYNCVGSCEITNRNFKCHDSDGHGILNLKSAIANSCNTFFYNFAFSVGKDSIYKMASSLGFGKKLTICENITASAGNLPNTDRLANIAQLANFSIGQGELLLSPISMLNLYCSIATDGKYYVPSIVEGTLKDGSFEKYDIGSPTRVMSAETAGILRECLKAVVEEGTGIYAKPRTVTAAGKTATAQTGKYENGEEINEGWFCGFFPAEKPEYVAVIFSENTKKQSKTNNEIFAEIADRISSL